MRSIVLLPYFSRKLPEYFSLFLASVEKNRDTDFLIFTNLKNPEQLPENVIWQKGQLKDINTRTLQQTGIDPGITRAYKLCDLKPFYGLIFSDLIDNYDYWAYGDMDVIFGNLDQFLQKICREELYDIISFRENWLSGCLCFFRNDPKINQLCLQSRDWKEVLSTPEHYFGYDEVSWKNGRMIFWKLVNGQDLIELKTDIQSFTEVVLTAPGLKMHFGDLVKESIEEHMLLEISAEKVLIGSQFQKGFQAAYEMAAYHLVSEKNRPYFRFPAWKKVPERYYISRSGFSRKPARSTLEKLSHSAHLLFRSYPLYYFKKIRKKLNR